MSTRTAVLESIKQLMQETDWDVIDKSVVKLQEAKDIRKELADISRDHEKTIQLRLELMRVSDVLYQKQKDSKIAEIAPLPVYKFQDLLENTNQ